MLKTALQAKPEGLWTISYRVSAKSDGHSGSGMEA
jgi:hypothetical protein